jgi:hypothetical protein
MNQQGPTGLAGAELWQHVAAGGDVSIALILPVTLVDNSYGVHSIGWGSDAPSGKHHNFKDLKGSDKAQFVFTDDTGAVVLDFVLDYLAAIGPGWGASIDSKEGKILTASATPSSPKIHRNPRYPASTRPRPRARPTGSSR